MRTTRRRSKPWAERASNYVMSLFGTLLRQGGKFADEALDASLLQAKDFGGKNGYFDEQAWINANPRPDAPSSSKESANWIKRKSNAKKKANSGPTGQAPLGYDSLGNRIMSEGELAYIRAHPRPFPGRTTAELSPEERKAYRQWEYGLRKFKFGRQYIRDSNNRSYQNQKDGENGLLARRKAKRDERTPEEVEADRERERLRNRSPERKKYNEEYHRRHYRENPGYYTLKGRERAISVKDQTPAHINIDAVNEIYRRRDQLNEAARASGSDMEFVIDHVVPLKGHRPGVATIQFADDTRTVSGLNVQDNLLIVPKNLNLNKGAWFEPGDDPMTINEVARRRLLQQAEESLFGIPE